MLDASSAFHEARSGRRAPGEGARDTAGMGNAEIELKFDADEGFALPDLADLPGVAQVPPAQVHDLEAVYYDTADYRLAVNRHTLGRRTGGHDAGWHLKRPRGDGFRDELQEPLGEAGAVPEALRRLV